MSRHVKVSPRMPKGRSSYTAIFVNSTGIRVQRGLGCGADLARAQNICAGLTVLRTANAETINRALELGVDPISIKLFFSPSESALVPIENNTFRIMQQAHAEALHYPAAVRPHVEPLLHDRIRLREEVESLHVTLGTKQRELNEMRITKNAIENSVLAQVARAVKDAPTLADARKEFEANVNASIAQRNVKDHLRAADKFIASLPENVKTIADIMPGYVSAFLDARASDGSESRRMSRKRAWRLKISRFLNWAAERYQVPSAIASVKPVSKKAVLRERGDIQWHSLSEVNAAIAGAPDAYWRALIATLAFSGLQLAELVWLRVADVEFSEDRSRAKLWVTTVDDGAERHLLKTDHRRRHVDIHARYLLPMLKRHIDEGRAGKTFLFPVPAWRGKAVKAGRSERWREQTLSTQLRGHQGGKNRKKTAGILPACMNAKSLRRTFGSLLLRSGKPAADVAAAMGNTEQVVRDHYARILGCEVDVDF